MIKHDLKVLAKIEEGHPGFLASLLLFENQEVPPCPRCNSADTAMVRSGLVGFSIALASATTKIHLLPNYNGEGIYFCNSCRSQFGPKEFGRPDREA